MIKDVDILKTIEDKLDTERGFFFFFRRSCIKYQGKFINEIDHSNMPVVLVHGNPHIENFVISDQGAGMVDFDRSRMGGYAWDIVRFLGSLALKSSNAKESFLSKTVLSFFLEGYNRGFSNPEKPYKEIISSHARAEYKVWFESVEKYLEANIKWTKRLRKGSIPTTDPFLLKLVKSYFKSRGLKDYSSKYKIEEAGTATGTFGNLRYLVLLSHLKKDKKVFIEIKSVYKDQDNDFYYNPYKNHAVRMIEASKVYAPGLEQKLGFSIVDGEEYWGREIPIKSGKIKSELSELEQVDMAFSVGSQLGRGHRISLRNDFQPKELEKHLQKNFDRLVDISHQMNKKLRKDFEKALKKMK